MFDVFGYLKDKVVYSLLGEVRMVTISVCVGSSCHLKGAYEIIEICEELIEN